ncbi:hypothetical protein AAVH_40655 [Aphelenchoides avenae]|nr:hypothetical protein AAVH_40655 [Aphelenchus avenae]
MWSEVVATKNPELLEQTDQEMEKAKKEYRKKEHDWIDRVNGAIRTTYAAAHGRVPKKLLLHKPEQGPKRIDRNKALRAQFDWMNPSDPSFIPVHLRKWWFEWWTKDYLQQRKSLPRRENFPWEAAKNVHREHWCTINSFGPSDTDMCQLFYLWAVTTVKDDNYKTNDPNFRDVMEQGLNALTMPEVNPQLEVTENFGPAPVPLMKEKQIRQAIEDDRERNAEENAEWDQAYEDDLEPGLKEPVQFKRNAVTARNPRKKPLTDEHMLAMKAKANFIGPRLRNKQLPPGVLTSAIKRMDVQQRRDREWEETKEADRLLQVTEIWRRKTLSRLRQLLRIPYASSEEARLDLPKELRNDHPGSSRAEEEEDEKQRKQQEFARQLQKSMKKEN